LIANLLNRPWRSDKNSQGRLSFRCGKVTADGSEFVAFNRVHPPVRALQSADPQRSSVEAHIVNAKVCSLTASQAVTVHHQEQQMIPDPLPSGLGRFKEGLDLGWIKEVLPPMRVGRTFNNTRAGKVGHGVGFLAFLYCTVALLSTKLR
jgi:hypothetical protein